VHGKIDVSRDQCAFDLSGEQPFTPRADIDNAGLTIVPARLDYFDLNPQTGPPCLQRVRHRLRLRQRQLAPPCPDYDFDAPGTLHNHCVCSGGL